MAYRTRGRGFVISAVAAGLFLAAHNNHAAAGHDGSVHATSAAQTTAAHGGTYSCSGLEQLWEQAGGPHSEAFTAAEIAMAESSGESDSMNYTDNGGTQTSVGLWQDSTGTHDYPASWTTPAGNTAEAVTKYDDAGDRFSPWGTYVSGAFQGQC
jgi:hypothetical protein